MKIEKTEWDCERLGRGRGRKSEMRKEIEKMQIGDALRIEHSDRVCNSLSCSAASWLYHIARTLGWEIQTYHENQYVLVVRRVK